MKLNGINHTLHERGVGQPAVLLLHYFGGSGRAWDAVMAYLPTASCIAPDLRGFGDTDTLRTSPAAWSAWLEHGSREDISARMAQIQVDFTTLTGANDPIISSCLIDHEVAPYFDATDIQRRVVPNVGHLLPLEAPQAVARVIGELID